MAATRMTSRLRSEIDDEARRHPPRHRDHRRRPGQRRLLRRRARPATGQEDGQPGRPDRLPPLLRRRAGSGRLRHHLLRVPRRSARAGRGRHGPHDRLAGRLAGRPRLLGGAPRAPTGSAPSATTTCSASPTPKGSRHELRPSDVGDEPLIAEHPEIPPSTRCRASMPSAPTPPLRRRAKRLLGELGFEWRRRRQLGGARRATAAAGSTTTAPPDAARHAGRRDRPPRRLGVDARGARAVARAGRSAAAAGRRR